MPIRHSAGTATKILDAAERMVQVRGFNAFSYADIAEAVGVRKASLHHHFATKAELGMALLSRYRHAFQSALNTISADTDDGLERLKRYTSLYRTVLRRRRMCLCGMLAADAETLPKNMRNSVAEFFAENEKWLGGVLEDGRTRGRLHFEGTGESLAMFVVSSLEGAMLVSRGGGSSDHFDRVAQRLIAMVAGGDPSVPVVRRAIPRAKKPRARSAARRIPLPG